MPFRFVQCRPKGTFLRFEALLLPSGKPDTNWAAARADPLRTEAAGGRNDEASYRDPSIRLA